MRFLSNLQGIFGFTRNEVRVVIFLTTTFLGGVGVRWYTSDAASETTLRQQFDYSASDSVFLERSKAIAQLDTPIPSRSQDSTARTTATPVSATKPINVNAATKTELMQLPGIGNVFADRIIAYREAHGAFRSVDELRKVRGIGKKKLERIRPHVSVK